MCLFCCWNGLLGLWEGRGRIGVSRGCVWCKREGRDRARERERAKVPWNSAVLQVASSQPPTAQPNVMSVQMQVRLEAELQGEAARPCAIQGA